MVDIKKSNWLLRIGKKIYCLLRIDKKIDWFIIENWVSPFKSSKIMFIVL